MCYQQQPVHEEDYKGFTIKIHQDQDSGSLNPYENNDGMYPMMVDGGRHDRYDYLDASAAFYPTTNQYRRHKKALMELLNVSQGEGDTANDTENAVTEAIGDAIREHDYDTLEAVGKILGVPCLNTSSIGYSQGDYMDLLVVWTPEFAKTTGVEKKDATYESMEANAKEYGAWAWNDIFGFTIEDQDGNEIEDGSCWGFIETETYPAEKMYVVQEARSAVDAHIEHAKAKEQKERTKAMNAHFARLKAWIKSHVPQAYREAAPAL